MRGLYGGQVIQMADVMILEKNAGLKYQSIIRSLEQDILEGKYLLGQRIPTQNDLSDHFGVSRPTIEKAMAEKVCLNDQMAVDVMCNRLKEPDMPARDIFVAEQLVVRRSCGSGSGEGN